MDLTGIMEWDKIRDREMWFIFSSWSSPFANHRETREGQWVSMCRTILFREWDWLASKLDTGWHIYKSTKLSLCNKKQVGQFGYIYTVMGQDVLDTASSKTTSVEHNKT